MDVLLHNPIADLYGPHFLILYGAVGVVVLAGAYFWIASHDSTGELAPLPIPASPDPYEVAYLRGGVNELIRVGVFDLINRGFLERREEYGTMGLTKKTRIVRANTPPSGSELT